MWNSNMSSVASRSELPSIVFCQIWSTLEGVEYEIGVAGFFVEGLAEVVHHLILQVGKIVLVGKRVGFGSVDIVDLFIGWKRTGIEPSRQRLEGDRVIFWKLDTI
jgi:hypothetical protein